MKNKAKILLAVVLIVLLACAMSACGKIGFTYVQNDDGTFTHILDVKIEGDISATSFTVDGAMNALESGLKKRGYEVARDDGAKSIKAIKNFDTISDLRKDFMGNGLSVAQDGITTDNSNAFIYRQDITGTPKISKEFFASQRLLVVGVLMDGGLLPAEADKVAEALKNADTSYSYVTPYRSVKTDADCVTRDKAGNYIHTWALDGEDNDVHITITAVEGAMWYGIAIIAAVVIVLIIISVKMIKDRRHGARAAVSEE